MFEVKRSYSHGSTHFSGQYLLRYFSFLIFSFAFLLPHTAQADGISWLETQVNADGSYANALDVSFPAQSTAEVLRAYHLLSQELQPGVIGARTFIDTQGDEKTEILSRKIIALAEAGGDTNVLVAKLLLLQNRDGGFGDQEGYQSRVVDTAFALNALGVSQSSGTSDAVGSAVSYLLREQSPDGGFSHSSVNNSSVYETALASIALQHFRFNFNLTAAIDGASDYLTTNQQVAGGWNSVWETSYALLALVPVTSDVQVYQSAVDGLRTAQAADGSWNQDVYETALALKAIYKAENVQIPEVPTDGAFTGQVFNASNGQPLAGVTVSLTDLANISTTSSNDGTFSINGIPAGEHTVSYQAAGFGSVTQTALSVIGKFTSLGNVQLTPLPNKGVVFGVVRDAATSQPLASITVDITGSTSISVVTNADGYFSAEVAPGLVSLSIQATGFDPVGGSADIVAGQRLNFSPLLNATGTTPAITTVSTKTTVVDANTNLPIQGASISIEGTAISGLTNNQGQLLLENIDAGSLNIVISATGYQSVSASTIAPAGSVIDLGVVTLQKAQVATKRTVKGFVTDAVTDNPISGATVNIEGTSISVITNSEGYYYIDDTGLASFNLVSSAVGYLNNNGQVTLDQPGQVSVNIQLAQAQISKVNIISITSKQFNYDSSTNVEIDADIKNIGQSNQDIRLYMIVSDEQGNIVDQFLVKDNTTAGVIDDGIKTVAAASTSIFNLQWFTDLYQAGAYKIKIQAVDASNSQLLSEKELAININSSLVIGGGTSSFPPIIQAGSTAPVELTALVRNNGNNILPSGELKLSIYSPDGVTEVHSSIIQAPELLVGKTTNIDFGNWIPTEQGSLGIKVRYVDSNIGGVLVSKLYVGDTATANIITDKVDVPVGNQSIHTTIKMTGVDVTTGSSTDPLFNIVRDSIEKGGEFVAREGVSWHQRNNCLGCHIQSQSVYGLAESLDKANIDLDASRFLFNSISTSQNDNGSLYLSHSYWTKVQTSLSLWGISSWPNKLETFLSRFKAAKHLDITKGKSNNNVYWDAEYNHGWWGDRVSFTATTMLGLTQVVKDSNLDNFQDISTYSMSPLELPIGIPANNISDIEFSSNGSLLVLDSATNSIYEFNPVTETKVTLATGLPSGSRGLAVTPSGGIFVVGSHGLLIEVNADGSHSTIASIGGNLWDIEVASDGNLYISSFSTVFKYTQGGSEIDRITSNLFGSLKGLTIDSNNNILVTDSAKKAVYKIAFDNTVSVFSSGLKHLPYHIEAYKDSFIVTNRSSAKVIEIGVGGIAQNIIGGSGYHSTAIDNNGEAWVYKGHGISQVISSQFDVTQLDPLRNDIIGGVRYLLSTHADNNSSNIVHAMRLQALIEARGVITDSTLLASIQSAVDLEDSLLRSRQGSDRGWGKYNGSASDPLVTAMVGIALDMSDPSPTDPVIRSTVEYLLNSQRTDGTWQNVNNGFSTRLGSTSFVMAFMPKALERLGGIDINLRYVVAAGDSLENPTINPTSIVVNADASVIYEWVLDGVTGDGRSISFDMLLDNLKPNETRAISSNAYFTFENSFTGEIIKSNIDVPNVTAHSAMSLVTLDTSKATYNANEDVNISLSVSNVSLSTENGTVKIDISRVGEAGTIENLSDIIITDLTANSSIELTSIWSTGKYLAGRYQVSARLYDLSNDFVNEKKVEFDIISHDVLASLRLGVDKPVYNTSDQVTIESLSKNITANTIIDGAVVKLKILNPDGSIFSEVQQSIGELASGNQRQENSIQSLSAVPQGIYFVEGDLLNASGTVLATDQTQFEVHEDLSLTITGSVAVEQPLVYIRDLQKCNNTINNVGTLDLNQGVFRQVLINVDTQQQVLFSDQVVQVISSGGTYQFITDVDTTDLDVGQYSCVLQRQEGIDWKTLAYDFFTLELGIDIEASADIASSGMRLLVLLDDPNYACLGEDEHDDEDDHDDKKKKKKKHDDDEHDDDSDHENNNCQAQLDQEPHGPANAPLLSEQRALLEGLLNQKAWSYTIVTNASDFTRELRSGTYNAYALLSETIKLDEKVQKELREAVFSGEKLLVVGDHDRRNEKLEDALGIDVHGKSVTPSSLIVDQVEAYVSTTMDFTLLDKSNAIELEGATQVASYNTDLVCSSEDDDDDHEDKHHKKSKKKHDDEDDDHDKKDDDHDDDNECQSSTIAVTHYNYGFGHSVYAGFDLLANAAMPAANTAFSDLLLAALKDLEGNSFALNTSAVVPVSINLNNLGIATPGQVIIPQPANTSFIDPGAAILQADGSLLWVFDLPVDEVKTLTFWLQLPDTANNTGNVDISAQVQAGTTPDLLDLETLQLQLPVLSSPSLQSVLDDLLLLKPEDKNFKKAHKKVEKAKKYQGQGKYEKVLKELLKASDYLAKTDHVAVTDVRKKLAFVIREIERQIP